MSLQASLQFFKDIAATKGTTAKLVMLALASETDKQVLVYALDPYRMFGIKKLPPAARVFPDPNIVGLFETLDRMVIRELTGHRALNALRLLVQEEVPEELLLLILNKDLRCGLAATSVNKVFPKLIPEFKVALAEEYEDDGIWPKYESEKFDGLRGLAFVTEDGVSFKTRNGLEITSVEHLHAPLMALPWTKGLVLDGEIKKLTGHFQDSSGSTRRKSEGDTELAFYVFDWLPIEEFLTRQATLKQQTRIEKLEEWGGAPDQQVFIVKHTLVHTHQEVDKRYKEVLARKGEGLILKDPNCLYEFRRSTAWTKVKDVQSADCRVKGIIPGKGKYAGKVGALEVDFEGLDDKVGSGISDEERKLWANNPDLILNKVVEVNYHEKTKDGHMRHSRLIKVRWDKE